MERVAVLNDKMPEKGLHTEGSLPEKKRNFDSDVKKKPQVNKMLINSKIFFTQYNNIF